ncbi:MAG: alginate lyase family protein [Ferruginibacter sp.]|nr:alginate lyase family protein [Ferruginibacter sp.]
MKKSLKLVVLFCVGLSSFCLGQANLSNTDIVKLDFKILEEKKAGLLLKDAALLPAYNELIKNADLLLSYQPVSVMEKTEIPPSGSKHDYMSIGPYWWPDPLKADGLPYIRKDGVVNPEVHNYPDKESMPKLCENMYSLALAYYFSGNEKYAKHVSKLLSVWFLDSATKMNPNVQFGQAIKGVTTGRAEGVIDTRQFIFALDAVELIKPSLYWPKQKNDALKEWFTAYLKWLNTSEIGKDEMNAKNNHGVWFDAQALSFALFIGDKKEANKIVERASERLDKQMDRNGFFPFEMERTTSLHYSVFILNAFNIIAQLSEKTDRNFYSLQTKSGKSLQMGINTMIPFLSDPTKWTGKQIKPFHSSDGYALLLRSASKYNCTDCIEIIKGKAGKNVKKTLFNLL